MPRFNSIDGQHVQFTQEEELAFDAMVQRNDDARPLELWLEGMEESDVAHPRAIEDIWDHIGITNAPQITQDRHAAKKTLRGERP